MPAPRSLNRRFALCGEVGSPGENDVSGMTVGFRLSTGRIQFRAAARCKPNDTRGVAAPQAA
jgi:hypothetical protein